MGTFEDCQIIEALHVMVRVLLTLLLHRRSPAQVVRRRGVYVCVCVRTLVYICLFVQALIPQSY